MEKVKKSENIKIKMDGKREYVPPMMEKHPPLDIVAGTVADQTLRGGSTTMYYYTYYYY